MRRMAVLLALVSIAALAPAARADTTMEITFTVNDPVTTEPYRVAGRILLPPGPCAQTAVLMIHGLSYGMWGWDFPVQPETYSVARALQSRGYGAVTIDLPGYGASSKPNGYQLTVESYAAMVAQMTDALRAGTYQANEAVRFAHVVLMGHSAGTEISELAASLYGNVDALIATGYTHVPSTRIVQDFFTGDYIRAAQSDYEYFGGDVSGRTEYMYSDLADPDVIAQDNRLANLTPSGEIYSIGPQPSGKVMQRINQPVLLVLAEKDLLFPSEYADEELVLFASAKDKQLHIVPGAGHSFMLHRNAAATNNVIGNWLDAHPAAAPRCEG